MKPFSTLLLIAFISYIGISQCNPPTALECETSLVFCSLDELDGYSCSNPDISNPTGPAPLCFGTGVPHNTSWWAFVGNGDFINMTFDFGPADCTGQGTGCNGIQVGILDDCGGNPLDCNGNCSRSTVTLSGTALNCHTYYVWVDGCCGDVCYYTINVTGGAPPSLPDSLSIPELVSTACPGSIAQICVEDLTNGCDAKKQWTVDGLDYPDYNNLSCLEIDISKDPSPIEICVTFTIGNPSIPNAICDQAFTCLTIVPDSIQLKIENDIFVCWEEHQGQGYVWKDSVIYESCIDPPCRKKIRDIDDCFVNHEAKVELAAKKTVPEVYKFICNKNELPLTTENGKMWFKDACDQFITWQDSNDYNCDTSYILNLSIFDPKITLSQSCGSCNKFYTLKSNMDYTPDCMYGNLSWEAFWTNEDRDTIGVGDSINTVLPGKYFYRLHINYFDSTTLINEEYDVWDSTWVHEIMVLQIPPPIISRTIPSCSNRTATYQVINKHDSICEYNWRITMGKGAIVSSTPDSSMITIDWQNLYGFVGELNVVGITHCGVATNWTSFFVEYSNEKINQLDDTIVCGKEFIIDRISDYHNDNWIVLKGSSGVLNINSTLTGTTIDVKNFGQYTFLVNASVNSCVTYDTITINFVETPKWSNPIIICDSTKEHYQLLFDVVGGDTSTLKVLDQSGDSINKTGTINFVTDWINNGDSISLTITDKNNCPTISLDTVFDCLNVAVYNPNQNIFQLFPNPAHNFIHIKGDFIHNNRDEIKTQIIDLKGNIITAPPKRAISGGIQVDIENLTPGMYFLQLLKGNERQVVKFVKM